MNRKGTSASQVLEMNELYRKAGMSLVQLGHRFRLDPKTVLQHVKKFGPTRGRKEAMCFAYERGFWPKPPRRYSIDTAALSVPSPAREWLLGLWLGDGSITAHPRACLALGEDLDVGRKVAKLLGFNGPIARSHTSPKCWSLEISSKALVERLQELGIEYRKSRTLKLPTTDPALTPHLLRGLWDSDGSWSVIKRATRPTPYLISQLALASETAVTQVAKIASVVLQTDVHVHSRKSPGWGEWIHRVGFTYAKARAWGEYLYSGSTAGMRSDRKYEIWKRAC